MFRKPITFVLGAGTSKEFSLPTGFDLKHKISEACRFRFDRMRGQVSGDHHLVEILKQKYDIEDVSKFTEGGNKLSESISLFPSIDEAIHYHSADENIVLLGKLSIARFILKAEGESNLIDRQHPHQADLDTTQDTWISEFLSIAISGLTQEESAGIFTNVNIINFNYDRTVEYYLYWALQQRAGITAEKAKEAISGLKVIRPYGSLGPLDWQENGIGFGGNGDLFSLASKIRTFTEQIGDDLVAQIDNIINESTMVIFLGFGFHEQNLGLFQPVAGKRSDSRNVWATVHGIDEKNFQTIGQSLKRISKVNEPRLFDWKANEFLSKFRQSISAEVG